MKGFVPTPPETVDTMVALLFRGRRPAPHDAILDPGCGTGEFIDGVIRWCQRRRLALPRITGVESDPRHLPVLRAKFEGLRQVCIEHADFLADRRQTYDFIVGNPPYVAITALSEEERVRYRARYATARGRFDLYLLFFEQALSSLAPGGRLVFITPEKYLYVETAGPLRDLLARRHVEEIRLLREDTFGKLVTYPTITVVADAPASSTQVVRRDGSTAVVHLQPGPGSWLPLREGAALRARERITCAIWEYRAGVPPAYWRAGGTPAPQAIHQVISSRALSRDAVRLGDVCLRISCGVATGADGVFVHRLDDLAPALRGFGHPTVAGRELVPGTADLRRRFVMLIPYDADGRLLPLDRLGALGEYLMRRDVRRRLLARTCVRRKPWYAFHETPALGDILRPKILCKDIGERPCFWADRSGEIVPRHSVYYIVPRDPGALDAILRYLRSSAAHEWLAENCQRASKGFLRLQSGALRRLPLPDAVAQAAAGSGASLCGGRSLLQCELPFLGDGSVRS